MQIYRPISSLSLYHPFAAKSRGRSRIYVIVRMRRGLPVVSSGSGAQSRCRHRRPAFVHRHTSDPKRGTYPATPPSAHPANSGCPFLSCSSLQNGKQVREQRKSLGMKPRTVHCFIDFFSRIRFYVTVKNNARTISLHTNQIYRSSYVNFEEHR